MLSPVILAAGEKDFFLLDLSDPMQKVAFESAFYQAFNKVSNQDLLREIWNWNDSNRCISMKISPAESTIYCWKHPDGKVLFYVGGSRSNESFSQFRYFGFAPPPFAGSYAEVMILFATEHFDGNLPRLVKEFLQPFCYHNVRSSGCSHLLATCAPPLLSLYLRWGWKLLESKEVKGETRHFLLYELT